MKKTISINLAGSSFYIDEDAFAKLDAYLTAVKAHFAKYPDSDEIVSDMEARLAEHFAVTENEAQRVISAADVAEMIRVMGTVADFAAEEGETNSTETTTAESTQKRLYRNPDDAVIGGVCSGIAAYFGIDPTIVRLLFGLSVLVGGFGIALYLILLVITPEAKTPAEKLRMRGEPVTLAQIEATVREQLKPETVARSKSAFTNWVRRPIRTIVNFISALLINIFRIARRLAGFAITVGTGFMMVFLIFLVVMGLANLNSPYIGVPLTLFITNWTHYALIGLVFLGAFIPLIFIQQLGVYFMTLRKMNFTIALGLLFVWVMSVIGGIAFFTRSLPAFEATYNELPQVRTAERVESVGPFDTLDLKGIATVELIEGPTTSVRISGPEQLLSTLSATTTDGVLQFTYAAESRPCLMFCGNHSRLIATVTAPHISTIKTHDVVRINAAKLSAAELTFELSDVSRAITTVSSTKLTVTLSDAARLELNGKTAWLEAKLSDVARLEASELQTNTSTISVSDASRAYVSVVKTLTAAGRDVGRIYYSGNPIIEKNLRDGARVNVIETEAEDYD